MNSIRRIVIEPRDSLHRCRPLARQAVEALQEFNGGMVGTLGALNLEEFLWPCAPRGSACGGFNFSFFYLHALHANAPANASEAM